MSISIDYQTTVFDLKPDQLGPNQAVLLHARTDQTSNRFYRSILYLHGYSDYFFQDHVCARFLAEGYDFYALDLRKSGRAILSPAHDFYRHYCRDLHEYDEEITLAIDHIIAQSGEKPRKILLLGHSTGGLLATVYGQHGTRSSAIDGLILNSPYLAALETSRTENLLIAMLIGLNVSVDLADHWYGQSIHRSGRGEWDFDLKKKPIDKVRVHGAFLNAIRPVHQAILRGEYHLQCPILFMCSDRSMKAGKEWRDEYHHVDLILNVQAMKQAASLIGSNITMYEISDGKHDLFLSEESVREKAFQQMFRWLEHLNHDWSKTEI